MRIAALFVGRIAGYNDTFESMKNNIFAGHDVDVFYSHNGHNKSDHLADFEARLNTIPGTRFIRGENTQATYPTHMDAYLYNNDKSAIHPNMWQMFYHLHNGIRIIRDHVAATGVTYDLVLYLRADMYYRTRLEYRLPTANTVYIPTLPDWGGICDQMAYGTLETMTGYADTFNHLDEYYDNGTRPFHPETFTLHNINVRSICVERFPLEAQLNYNRHNL
jgi:hypothetical protein